MVAREIAMSIFLDISVQRVSFAQQMKGLEAIIKLIDKSDLEVMDVIVV